MLAQAKKAAHRWPLRVRSLTLAAQRENTVFMLEADEGFFALRLHRPGYRTTAEMTSELRMMAMLESRGISVPRPLAGNDRQFLQTVDDAQVSVLSWLDGEPLGTTGEPLVLVDRPGTFRALGELIANMHKAFDSWKKPPGFARPRLDMQGLVGDNPAWGRFWENPMLRTKQRDILVAARDKLRIVLADARFEQGLIHADCVSENLLVSDKGLSIIDFDDSGVGFRLQDIATALVKHQNEPDYEDLKSALLEGYAARTKLENDDIELFLFVRYLSYVGWIVPRMIDENGKKRSEHYITDAVRRSEVFLQIP
jgi:Ser/Thr protein kinase RdoA (MazF antagonist)